jgi:hypothetical protein
MPIYSAFLGYCQAKMYFFAGKKSPLNKLNKKKRGGFVLPSLIICSNISIRT